MPALQPWMEIESDPEFQALPEQTRAGTYANWRNEFVDYAKQQGAQDEEIGKSIAQTDFKYAIPQAAAAFDAFTAPHRIDWTPSKQDAEKQHAALGVERSKLIEQIGSLEKKGPGAEPVFTPRADGSTGFLSDYDQAHSDASIRLKEIDAQMGKLEPMAYPKEEQFPDFPTWQRQEVAAGRQEAPGLIATAGAELTGGLLNQAAGVLRTFAPSLGTEGIARDISETAGAAQAIGALNEGAAGQIGRGLGAAGSLLVGNPAGTLGTVVVAARAAQGAHEQVLRETHSPELANEAGLKTFPALLAYATAGRAAARIGGRMAGPDASAINRAVVGAGTATAGNIAVSRTLAAIEGQPWTLQNAAQDVLFGVFHGAGEYRNASEEVRQQAKAELERRGMTVAEGEQSKPALTVEPPEGLPADVNLTPLSEEPSSQAAVEQPPSGQAVPSLAAEQEGQPITSAAPPAILQPTLEVDLQIVRGDTRGAEHGLLTVSAGEISPESAAKMSDDELRSKLTEHLKTIKVVAGKQSANPENDRALDALYRVNTARLYAEAKRRGVLRTAQEPSIERYLGESAPTPKSEPIDSLLTGGDTERIIATAVRNPETGKIAFGRTIHLMLYPKVGMDPVRLTGKQITESSGYITSTNRFVTQDEGQRIASKAKQIQGREALSGELVKESLGKETPAPVPAAPIEAKAGNEPETKAGELVLWGRKPGEPWVKLSSNTSNAEMARRQKDGWEVLRHPKGESPNEQPPALPKLRAMEKQGDLLAGSAEDAFNLAGQKLRNEAPAPAPKEPSLQDMVNDALRAYGDSGRAIASLRRQIENKELKKADIAKAKMTIAALERGATATHIDVQEQERAAAEREANEAEQHAAAGKPALTGAEMNEAARIESEKVETAAARDEEGRNSYELTEAIKKIGGLPPMRAEAVLKGEVRRIWNTNKGKMLKLVRGNQKLGLDQVTQALKEYGFTFDTPSEMLDALERAFGGERIIGFEPGQPRNPASDWTSATDESSRRLRGLGEAGAINIPQFPNRKMSELDRATTEHSAKLQKSFDEARRVQKEIAKAIPKESRQNAASIYREANGDMALLKTWETGAKQKWMREAARDAQTLSPEEIAIVKKAEAAFAVLERRGNRFDVLTGHKDNYIPHVWDLKKPGSGFGGRRLQERFRFNKARTLASFFEGDQADMKPKTLALGKLLPAYIHEMNKVIADRQLVQDIAAGNAKDGTPLASPRGNVKVVDNAGDKAVLVSPRATRDPDTREYRVMNDQAALSDWTWEGKDTDGKPVFVKADLALHPEAHKRLTAILGKSAIREWYSQPSEGFARVPRAIAKGLDIAQSAMKREMFGLLPPFHQVQEGTHAIGHLVNPFFNIPKIDMRNPAQMDAAQHGLMLMPDRTSSAQYVEGVGSKQTLLSRGIRKIGAPGRAIADVIDGYQDYLFHKYIPGLKFKTYEAILGRNTHLYAKELASGELTVSDVKLLSAEQANAAYGHLNYALLDRNPTMQHLAQLTLLAPDFLEARSRFVGNAMKGALGSKVGVEQFRAIATLALIQAGIAYTLSKLMGDEWEPTHPFEIKHNGRRYSMRSVPEDIASAITDTQKFIYGRVNPLTVKGAIQLGTGLNYRGEKVDALQTAEELLAQYIPITARSMPGVRSLTETGRNAPTSSLEQLAGSLGLRISRYSPISDVHKLAGEWMEKQDLPKDKGVYPVSKYQQLRYALEDSDTERAKAAYAKLRETMEDDKIQRGFHDSMSKPFTQNKGMDQKFRDSLGAKDRAIYDLAQQKREDILWRFDQFAPGGSKPRKEQKEKKPGK